MNPLQHILNPAIYAAAVLALMLTTVLPVHAQGGAATGRRPLTLDSREGLYQRIIVRPGATVAERPEANAPSRPVPGFTVFYVYERKQVGQDAWVEVGEALDGRTQGWIFGPKTIDWKHNLVLAFNNPAGRELAMFFEDAEVPRRLWLNTASRAADAARYRTEARDRRPGPVIALEPATYVDITRQFYLLPILKAEQLENERGERARLLEVVSVPAPNERRPETDPEALRNYKGVVVFVIDTTMSMGPYIEQTREAVRRIVARIRDTAVRDNFRFGVVAYRDHTGGDPALGYVTQSVYLPSLADPPDRVLEKLAPVAEARISNQDFDEDAIAGLKMSLDKVDWQQFGGRFIVLITDAGARDHPDDPLSETKLGIPEIKALARSEAKQVKIFTIHLKTPEGQSNHARAERQYRDLSEDPAGGSLYYSVAGGGAQAFRQIIDPLTDALLGEVGRAVGRPIAGQRSPQNETERRIVRQVEAVSTAARLSYLGRTGEVSAPDVVRGFVLDEDPTEPVQSRKPLDVRVLLTKNQLSDLARTLQTIITASNANRLSPENFFQQVRAASTTAMRGQRLGGAFASFLEGLPYRSRITRLTQEGWLDLRPSDRSELINAMKAKLRLYEELNGQASLWVDFHGRPGSGEAFYPLPIDQLP